MRAHASKWPIRIFTAGLLAALGGVLAATSSRADLFGAELLQWTVLTALFMLTETADLYFHDQRARWGLSATEAILFPILVGLTFSQAVWGVTIAIAVASIVRPRLAMSRKLFNIGEYGVAAAAAAGVWVLVGESSQVFSPRNAVASVLAVLTFSLLTHLVVAAAFGLAGLGSFLDALRTVAPSTGWNLAGNILVGLFFAAAYLAGGWTVVLFPLPLMALYFGYRAVVRQEGERERVETLHSASRALAASMDLDLAMEGFVGGAREIVSAWEARAVIKLNDRVLCTTVDQDGTKARMEPVMDWPMVFLMEKLEMEREAIIVREDTGPELKELPEQLGARSFVAVPLLDDDVVVGYLLALNRIGADDFAESDARVLQALGHELVLTLHSYQLFAEVLEERERFQRIFSGSKEGICLLDDIGTVRAWNPALERISGYQESDVIGSVWSEKLLIRNTAQRRLEGLELVETGSEELELVTREGPARYVAVQSGPVQTRDETGWVVLVRDVSAEHQLEEAKSDFLSTISHELRTPLTSIKGSLLVIARPDAKPEVREQMIEIVRRGADRLERLVMNLLSVSQMEMGDVPVAAEEVGLSALVKRRAASLLVDNPRVELKEPDEDVLVRADKDHLGQIIDNLLDNARKFGGPEGKVTIEVSVRDGFGHLSVTDEGPGIAALDQDRVFERFVRLGDALTRETQGAGVGLFIIRRSVEAMGGRVWIESEPGNGATFHIDIPLARPMVVSRDASTA
jgi:PAS domain S-box-containing protein